MFYIDHDFVLDNILYKRGEIKYYSMNRNFHQTNYLHNKNMKSKILLFLINTIKNC